MKILVNGASWTTGCNTPNRYNWSNSFAEKGHEVVNLARDGISVGTILRTTMNWLENNDCDAFAMLLPSIINRREMVLLGSDDKLRLTTINYSILAQNSSINSRIGKTLQRFVGEVLNNEDDLLRTLTDLNHLILFLKSTGKPFHVEFDSPFHILYSKEYLDMPKEVVTTAEVLIKNIKPYMSFQDAVESAVLNYSYMDNTRHPTVEGHKLIGDLFCRKLNL